MSYEVVWVIERVTQYDRSGNVWLADVLE